MNYCTTHNLYIIYIQVCTHKIYILHIFIYIVVSYLILLYIFIYIIVSYLILASWTQPRILAKPTPFTPVVDWMDGLDLV